MKPKAQRPPGTVTLQRSALRFLAGWLCLCATFFGREATQGATLLTNIQQVLNLATNKNAPAPIHIDVEGVVTLTIPSAGWIYVQDQAVATLAISTNASSGRVSPGQKVRVQGTIGFGLFAPYIGSANVTVLGTAPMPEPQREPLQRYRDGAAFGHWIEVEGTIRDAFQEWFGVVFRVSVNGEPLEVEIDSVKETVKLEDWPDTRARFRGIVWTQSDSQNRPVGFRLHVPGFAHVEKLPPNPGLLDQRVKTRATFLHQIDHDLLAFRTESGGLIAEPFIGFGRMDGRTNIVRAPHETFTPGDVVEIISAPFRTNRAVRWIDAEFKKISAGPTPQPLVLKLDAFDAARHDGELITLEATAFSVSPDVLELDGKSTHFEAILPRTNLDVVVPENSRVRVTGICRAPTGKYPHAQPFEILLRNANDLTVLGPPRFWEHVPAQQILKYFAAITLLGLAWILTLKRQIQSAEARNRALLDAQLRFTEAKALRSEATTRMISYFATSLLEQNTEEDIVWDLAKNCVAKLGFEDCVIYLTNAAGTELIQKAAYGPKSLGGREIKNPLTIPIGKGIVGNVAQSGRPEWVADTRKDPRYIVDDTARLSELAVPIVSNGRTIGVIDSEHSRTDFFSQEHLEALSAIASLCANKIVRVRAEVQLQNLNQELEKRITERTAELSRANQNLRSTEERFSKAFLSSPCLMSLSRMRDGRLIDINEAFLRILDTTKSEAIGKTTLELGLWDNDGERAQFLEALRNDGAIRYRERRFIIDGHEHYFLHSADVIMLEDDACLLTVAIDISDRKKAEAELLKSLDRERELSKLKSSFVATVSHEFRTPLEIIMSSGEILDRYLDRLRPEQRKEHLQAIHDAVRRMSSLMEEALVLGKVESGKLQLEQTPIDLVNFCARLIDEIHAATEDRCPIELRRKDLPFAPAIADESLLRHILTNLLTNAVKYSKPGAPVTLTLGYVEGFAVFQVTDTGCGIPAADQDRLFQSFHRGQNVGKIPGTGLGLVIAKRCVELHNGRIKFQSEEGKGTTFQVRLPLYPQEIPETPTAANSTWFFRKSDFPPTA